MEIGKASNLPGAGCPGLPGLNANSRPGAGCPGKPPHRYICEYIHLQWKSKQPAWGGLPVAALPCPSIHAYRHRHRENKQPAWGGLHGTAHYPSIHVHTSITHGTTAACLGRRAWGSITSSLHTCIFTYKVGKQAAGLGRARRAA